MNQELERVAQAIGLQDDDPLRLAFAAACIARVQHLLEEPRTIELAAVLRDAAAAGASLASLSGAADEAARLARSHRGHASIDGSGHSAVSATHALANALAGKALAAADYAAYAATYAYGRYAAGDPGAFEPEFQWQVECLQRLHQERTTHAAAHRDRRLLG